MKTLMIFIILFLNIGLMFGQTRRVIDFETGDKSQIDNEQNPQNNTLVPSSLSGGGNYALRCFVPEGASDYYVGFGVDVDAYFSASDRDSLFIRFYVKFEPTWLWPETNRNFKQVILEVDHTGDYNIAGRTFVNFNSESASDTTIAPLVMLCYADPAEWHNTGFYIENNNEWHCIEINSYRNLASPENGHFKIWVDGALRLNLDPFNSGNNTINWVTIGYRNGPAQRDMYMQYDEVVISNEYIGPIDNPTPQPAPKIETGKLKK